jgi:hypothetical protein
MYRALRSIAGLGVGVATAIGLALGATDGAGVGVAALKLNFAPGLQPATNKVKTDDANNHPAKRRCIRIGAESTTRRSRTQSWRARNPEGYIALVFELLVLKIPKLLTVSSQNIEDEDDPIFAELETKLSKRLTDMREVMLDRA